MKPVVAVIGAGKIGSLIGGRLASCGYRVIATRKHRERLGELERLGLKPYTSNLEAFRDADVVILSVKPWDVPDVAREAGVEAKGKILVSIVAGVSRATLSRLFPGATVYRAMPNLGVEMGESLTGVAEKRGEESDRIVEEVLGCIGEVYWIPERLMAAWTGLLGSGPGILASIADALEEAFIAAGLPLDYAKRLVPKLFALTARLLERHGAIGLRDAVATPGGTTVEALRVLERGARGGIIEAFLAAVEKAGRLEESIERSVAHRSVDSG